MSRHDPNNKHCGKGRPSDYFQTDMCVCPEPLVHRMSQDEAIAEIERLRKALGEMEVERGEMNAALAESITERYRIIRDRDALTMCLGQALAELEATPLDHDTTSQEVITSRWLMEKRCHETLKRHGGHTPVGPDGEAP